MIKGASPPDTERLQTEQLVFPTRSHEASTLDRLTDVFM